MESMTCLILDGSGIQSGWERLDPLRQLRVLNFHDCGLTELPAALAGMKSRTSLSLNGSDIQSDWEHLRPLTRLQKLGVGRTFRPGLSGRSRQYQR